MENIQNDQKSKFDELFDGKNDNGSILDFGYVGTGTTPSMKNDNFYKNNDIPFIKPSDLDDVNRIISSEFYIDEAARSVARIFPAGTVLVSCIGTIGKIGISTFEASCNQQINYIIPTKNEMSRYIAYEIRKKILPMVEEISQIKMTVAIINKNNFEKIKVYIPNDEELFKFNDFIEKIDKLKFNVLTQSIKSKFDELLNENLVKVPLHKLCQIIRGVTYDKKDVSYAETTTKILTADNINLNGSFILNKIIYLNEHFQIDNNQKILKNDIFMCFSSGSKKHVGKSTLIKYNTDYFAGGFMGILRPYDQTQSNIISRYLNSDSIRNEMSNNATGTNIQNISNLDKIEIPMPKSEDLLQFNIIMDKYDKLKFYSIILFLFKIWYNLPTKIIEL